MARFLKQGRDADAIAADEARVRATVEGILADIAARGDKAVRELSVKFDRWDREDLRLTDREIKDALAELTQRNIDDIKFAQAQVGRLGQLEDIMGAIVFLASDASSLMTGSALVLDGGWTAD